MKWFPWTLVRKDTLQHLRVENTTLREDAKNYVTEIHKHKILLSQLRTGSAEVFRAIEKMGMKVS